MPNIFRIRTVVTGVAGYPAYVTHYFNGNPDGGGLNAALAVKAFWTTCAPLLSNRCTYAIDPAIFVFDQASGDVTGVNSTGAGSVNGTNANAIVNTSLQALLTLRTGSYRFGRPIIGKSNVPGLVTNDFDANGNLAGSVTGGFQGAANTLRTSEAGGILNGWGVYSRPRLDKFGFARPGAFTTLSSVTANAKPSILRSRRD